MATYDFAWLWRELRVEDLRREVRGDGLAVTVIYGAITAYVLPVFYALLGACAFALRNIIPHGITQ
jgi:hypothetical protein